VTADRFEAFAKLYGEGFRPVWSYVVRLGADRALAEDIAQEAFIRWWDHGDNMRQPAARSFLYTTATRLLADHWRRQRRFVPWDEELDNVVSTDADALLDARAWQALSLRQRQILWLAYAEEFTHAEIATIAGISAASVKVLLSRARAKFQPNAQSERQP
jgi:RNA polymerase sigma-70 factor (ECF subfamily)